jgi:class 3 adenylate cyclase
MQASPTEGPDMERKLAAVLSTDVVGYSRLMAADEKGSHARLKALRCGRAAQRGPPE